MPPSHYAAGSHHFPLQHPDLWKTPKALHPVDKKKPASPEGDGFPSTVLRSFPLTQLLAHEVDTDQKQRQ